MAHIDLIHSIIAQFSNMLPKCSQISPCGQEDVMTASKMYQSARFYK